MPRQKSVMTSFQLQEVKVSKQFPNILKFKIDHCNNKTRALQYHQTSCSALQKCDKNGSWNLQSGKEVYKSVIVYKDSKQVFGRRVFKASCKCSLSCLTKNLILHI